VTSAGGVRATGTLQGSTLSAVADGSTVATLSSSGNIQFRGAASYGSGAGVIGISNATTAPSTSPTGGGILFVNSGALAYRGTSGGNTTVVNADGTTPFPLLSANNTFTGVQAFNNAVNIGGGSVGSVGLEIGSTLGSATTPFIDFHSGATAIDFDSRIIASGGNGTNGQGTLTYTAATNTFTGTVGATGITTTGAVNLNYASPTIASNNASAASIFTGTVTGVTIGSSTIRTTAFPADGTTATATAGAGYMGLPQNATTTGAYTIVAADAGRHIYASATRTVTINSNANLALPIGTTITFIAGTGATMTIAITSDTLILAGPGTTGSRTLAPFGMATAVKITSTSWIISGNGLT
jgi:hypothetical protein